jgi:biotin transport system permease protein
VLTVYRPGISWLHRLSAAQKFIGLILGTAILLSIDGLFGQVLAFGIVALISLQTRVMTRSTWFQLRGLVLLVLALGLYRAWLQGWDLAIVATLRMLTLILLALIIAASTPIAQTMNLIEVIIKPLDKIPWVDSEKIALTVGVTLRMIPELTLQWQQIKEAQMARGLDRNLLACMVPMLVRTLKRAQDLADAIDSR